jgi:hypothetical protein
VSANLGKTSQYQMSRQYIPSFRVVNRIQMGRHCVEMGRIFFVTFSLQTCKKHVTWSRVTFVAYYILTLAAINLDPIPSSDHKILH